MSYLLDTHVLVWMAGRGPKAGPGVVERISDPSAQVVVSAISALEVAIKVRLGKFPGGADLAANWSRRIDEFGADRLPVDEAHAVLAGSMDWAHRDPFDRLLVAQASVEGLTLVTADPVVLRAPGVTVLPWS